MKLGFRLRKVWIEVEDFVRRASRTLYYVLWFIFDFSKFKRIKTEKITNLLIIGGGATGDVYITLGIVNQFSKNYPNVNVYYLTTEKNMCFIKNPKINVLSKKTILQTLRKVKFEGLAVLSPLINDLFSFKAYKKIIKIPYRSGCDWISPSKIFKNYPIPLTKRVFPRFSYWKYNWIAIFEKLGFKIEDKPKFYFTNKGAENAKKFIKKYKISKNEKIIFLHPWGGSLANAKKHKKVPSHWWPFDRWEKLATGLIKKYDARIIFTGIKNEREIIEKILSKIKDRKKIINAAGELSIEDTASLMKKSDLLIGIDTSIIHFGCQTGIPVIDLVGGIRPKLVSPWTDKQIILYHGEVCNKCNKFACPEGNPICMKAITVQEVLEATNHFLTK